MPKIIVKYAPKRWLFEEDLQRGIRYRASIYRDSVNADDYIGTFDIVYKSFVLYTVDLILDDHLQANMSKYHFRRWFCFGLGGVILKWRVKRSVIKYVKQYFS